MQHERIYCMQHERFTVCNMKEFTLWNMKAVCNMKDLLSVCNMKGFTYGTLKDLLYATLNLLSKKTPFLTFFSLESSKKPVKKWSFLLGRPWGGDRQTDRLTINI